MKTISGKRWSRPDCPWKKSWTKPLLRPNIDELAGRGSGTRAPRTDNPTKELFEQWLRSPKQTNSFSSMHFPKRDGWTPRPFSGLETSAIREKQKTWKSSDFQTQGNGLRSIKIFMDICVRCGACADKCHFYLGSGDPKNMPVLRAELLRSVYRKDFSLAGKLMGKMVGARELTEDVLKEWFMYFFQCTECRRCSLFCPYGIDTAE